MGSTFLSDTRPREDRHTHRILELPGDATRGVTDFLAAAFTIALPGAAGARGAALALLDAAPPLRRVFARRMMLGLRGPL